MSLSLKCKIHNVEYSFVVQGQTFSEEYNETLDSGTIIIDHVEKIKNLKPYDDVYIYDGTFEGFDRDGNVQGKNKFYKHFLINQFTEDRLNLNRNEYKYKIELFSETKGLETIQLPNISITQPRNIKKKISILEYLKKFINMYSPKIKVAEEGKKWKYVQKYSLSKDIADLLDKDEENPQMMAELFGDSYTPDFTLNSPNLRDVLSKLMISKDRIPYVYNNVIYAMDITKRRQEFNTANVNWISASRSSSNHADNLRTNYINALSQENTCRNVEFLGFRNSSNSLMTIDNMRLETKFPIYKINKIYMCYYKKIKEYTINSNGGISTEKMFLCKQDITPLVKLNSERNLLSQDWNKFGEDKPSSVEEMSQYKMCTIGYDIGSNFIDGWGTKYTYPKGWWDIKKSYVQNIFEQLDSLYPYGVYSYNYLLDSDKNSVLMFQQNGTLENVISPFSNEKIQNEMGEWVNWIDNIVEDLTVRKNVKDAIKLKSFFFIIDYTAFYNGSIIHSKDYSESEITMNDNQSSSLALLEIDGLSQKEKINRFGNKGYVIPARYTDVSELQPLGSVLKLDDSDDIIIYHREYSIYENYILCTYYGMHDYVLKNYFTSVYAKHRPYNLMSYGESVYRSENKKMFLFLSKDKIYFENENIKFNFSNLKNGDYKEKLLLNCFYPSEDLKYIIEKDSENKINYGYFIFDNKKYVTDINCFVSGHSMCFNLKMYDNVSMGNYISDYMPEFDYTNVKNDFTGSVQEWYINVDDKETGFVENVGIYVCHVDQSEYFDDKVQGFSEKKVEQIYEKIFKLPFIQENYDETNVIGNNFNINKDNKELIDMTFQIEPITNDNNIVFSQWFMKLNDFISNYKKYNTPKKLDDTMLYYDKIEIMYSTLHITTASGGSRKFLPLIILKVPKSLKIENYNGGAVFENTALEYIINIGTEGSERTYYVNYHCTPIKLSKIYGDNNDNLDVECTLQYEARYWPSGTEVIKTTTTMPFMKITSFANSDELEEEIFDNENFNYYSNVKINPNDGYYDVYSGEENTKKYQKIFPEWDPGFQTLQSGNGATTRLKINYENSEVEEMNFMEKEYGITPLTLLETPFPQNQYVVFSDNFIKKTIVYDEYGYGQMPSHLKIKEDIKVNECFKILKYYDGKVFININLIPFRQEKPSSIQYWYLDNVNVDYTTNDFGINENSLNFSKSSYKFVFGVNVTEEDYARGYVRIYISLLSNRETKVYDEYNNHIGYVTNYIEDNSVQYGENQFYTPLKENE